LITAVTWSVALLVLTLNIAKTIYNQRAPFEALPTE
jgi:hypothetical protein